MGTKYSNHYAAAAGVEQDTSAPRHYKGPNGPMTKGGYHVVRGEVEIATGTTIGASDVVKLCGVPAGAKLMRITIVPSGDLDASNSFTFNLGWTSNATAHDSAASGLQGSAAYSKTAADLITADAAEANDELIMTRAAGALSAGTLRFVAEFDDA